MCPACVASAGTVIGGVLSTGGLTSLIVTVIRKKKSENSNSKQKE